jgi:hypothetical protein
MAPQPKDQVGQANSPLLSRSIEQPLKEYDAVALIKYLTKLRDSEALGDRQQDGRLVRASPHDASTSFTEDAARLRKLEVSSRHQDEKGRTNRED